ncbi:MAG: dihydroorotase [Planctomycetota bacterium]|jgi:dihydroorotase
MGCKRVASPHPSHLNATAAHPCLHLAVSDAVEPDAATHTRYCARMSEALTMLRPDDWHLHFRDGEALCTTVPATARSFGRAIVMPNLQPPVTTVASARSYRDRILEQVPNTKTFEPLMTLYLTDRTDPSEIELAADSGFVAGCKLYPAGATTNSDAGVTSLAAITEVLERMQACDLPLLVHGEVTDSDVDVFDREAVFIDRILAPLTQQFPGLRVVFEHITTSEAVGFVESAGECVAATLTPQHLLMNRNDLFQGGLQPHHYCLPVLKRDVHQTELRRVVASGHPSFFLGTDSAPHARNAKESACGCAGCFSAPAAIELYAQVFDELGVMNRLEAFAAHYGPDFYRYPRNTETIRLVREEWTVPDRLDYMDESAIVPYWAGRALAWRHQDNALQASKTQP